MRLQENISWLNCISDNLAIFFTVVVVGVEVVVDDIVVEVVEVSKDVSLINAGEVVLLIEPRVTVDVTPSVAPVVAVSAL